MSSLSPKRPAVLQKLLTSGLGFVTDDCLFLLRVLCHYLRDGFQMCN